MLSEWLAVAGTGARLAVRSAGAGAAAAQRGRERHPGSLAVLLGEAELPHAEGGGGHTPDGCAAKAGAPWLVNRSPSPFWLSQTRLLPEADRWIFGIRL